MTNNIEELNKQFAFDDGKYSLIFKEGEGNIPVLDIKNECASVRISLQGAHVLSWIPLGQKDVIWLSTDASFKKGKSIRGGIPLCWPWFGAHDTSTDFPAHGFARTVFWQVTHTEQLVSGETQVRFKLDTQLLDENIKPLWQQPTVVEYNVIVGKNLKLELTTFNKSESTIKLGQALHTYFNINDLKNTHVIGLDGKKYLDKTEDFKCKQQVGDVVFSGEVDRIYLDTADDIVIDDKKRKLIIKKQGSASTVVWNPWQEVANKMGDLGKEGYLKMLCVESANAAKDIINIKPGDSHALQVTYEVSE